MRLLAALAAGLLLLAGCAQPTPSDASTTGPGATSLAPSAGPAPVAGNASGPGLADRTVTLYLTAGGTLEAAAPAAGSVALPNPLVSFTPLAFSAIPLQRSTTVPDGVVHATLWMQADAPMPSNGAFDVGLWFGGARGHPFFGVHTFPSPVLPGAPVKVELDLDLEGEVPAFLPPGEAPGLLVAAFGDYVGTARVLVGGETASSLTVRLREVAEDPLAAGEGQAVTSQSGSVQAVTNPNCGLAEGVDVKHLPVAVAPQATYLQLRLAARPSPAPTDIDVVLSDGETRLAAGHTPLADEGIFLAGPAFEALRGKTLDAKVVGCSGGAVTFDLAVEQGLE